MGGRLGEKPVRTNRGVAEHGTGSDSCGFSNHVAILPHSTQSVPNRFFSGFDFIPQACSQPSSLVQHVRVVRSSTAITSGGPNSASRTNILTELTASWQGITLSPVTGR